MLLLLVSGTLLIPTAAAAVTTTQIFPNGDNFAIGWDSATDGCQTDSSRWDELDEFPHDGGTTCRTGVVLSETDNTLTLELQTTVLPAFVDVDVRFFMVARIVSGDGFIEVSACDSAVVANVTGLAAYTQVSTFYETCLGTTEWSQTVINTATVSARCSDTTQPDGTTCSVTAMWAEVIVTTASGDEPSAGAAGFPPDMTPVCAELGPADWILPTTSPGSLNVTIEDHRREASLALQYLVNWGDNTGTITPATPVSHTYARPDIYTITMRIQYRDGSIHIFASFIDLRGNNCALSAFVANFFPALGLLGGLTAVGALIVTLSQRKATKRMRKYLLVVTVVAFGIIIAVAIYMRAAGIPLT